MFTLFIILAMFVAITGFIFGMRLGRSLIRRGLQVIRLYIRQEIDRQLDAY